MSAPPAPRTCASCGTEIARAEARFCEHCGAELPSAAPQVPPPDVFGDVPARFRALEQHPELGALLAARPAAPELAGKLLPSLLLLGGLLLAGLALTLLALQLCPPLFLVPLTLVVAGGFAAVKELVWNARTPLVARAALVAGLRAQVQAGAEHSHSNTRHFVVLQDASGAREEHECLTSAIAGLEVGALGVAYLKGKKLVAFARVPV